MPCEQGCRRIAWWATNNNLSVDANGESELAAPPDGSFCSVPEEASVSLMLTQVSSHCGCCNCICSEGENEELSFACETQVVDDSVCIQAELVGDLGFRLHEQAGSELKSGPSARAHRRSWL